jgi:hypothetical protein
MTAPSTVSLEEYADALLGGHEPAQLQWLTKHLRGESKPVLPGFKVGRKWRATEADIETAIELLRPQRVQMPVVPSVSSMSKTSQRRLGLAQ